MLGLLEVVEFLQAMTFLTWRRRTAQRRALEASRSSMHCIVEHTLAAATFIMQTQTHHAHTHARITIFAGSDISGMAASRRTVESSGKSGCAFS